MRKYKLLKNDSIQHLGTTLYRIEATANFGRIKKGEKGGYIESVENLHDNARVYDNARVCGDAWIQGNARVSRTKDYLCIGPIGEDRTITCTKSNKTIIAGCWIGTLSQFKKAIKEKYPDGCDYNWFFGAITKYFES